MEQKVAIRSRQALENSLCQPSGKWVHFSNQGRIEQKERDWLHLPAAVPRTSKPHCPKAIGYGKPFT